MGKITIIILIVLSMLFTGCAPAPIENADNKANNADTNLDLEQVIETVVIETVVSELIHVNQVGYRPLGQKIAVINGHSGSFQLVRSADGEIVFEGNTSKEPLNDVSTGDSVFYADFSEFEEPGRYFVSIKGVGRSYDFSIDNYVYADLTSALLKFMYFQRCGVELLPAHAGDWARKVCHLSDGYVLEETEYFKETAGGWHDAGDYGKYTVPTAVTLAGLLMAYEFFPSAFEKDINIPESGNNMPDILDESRFALDWLLKMQDKQTGGVHHKLSTKHFPGFVMPHADFAKRYITPVSPTATGAFAAIMAMASRIYADIDDGFSKEALVAAESAWQWLVSNPDAPNYKNPPGVHTGEYGDWNNADERYWAAVELYRTTGESKYHDSVLSYSQSGNFDKFGLGWQAVAGFGSVSYLFMDENKQSEELSSRLENDLILDAEHFVRLSGFNGYKISLSQDDYFWGSNMLVMNRAIHLIIAYLLRQNDEFAKSAQDHLHYLLGRNALSQSFVTGFGGNPIMNPHHRPSGADTVKDPVPGMVAGGPNSRLQDPTAQQMLTVGMPPARAFVDHEGSWSTNEVTTYWNSPAVFVSAFFTAQTRGRFSCLDDIAVH